MKILILPSIYITKYSNRNFRILLTFLKSIVTRFDLNFEASKQFYYSTEHYHYSHIPMIIGENNTYIVGEYYDDYSTNNIPDETRYPSLHNSPKATHISFDYAIKNITIFDAIIIGIRTGEKGKYLRNIARKKNIFTAYLDYSDHPEIYHENLITNKNLIYRSLNPLNDFDIFFKHDIPLNYDDEKLYPICPTPIKFENYPKLIPKNFKQKNLNISFLGRLHKELQKERSMLVEYLEENFKNTYLKKFKFNEVKRLTLYDYSNILNDSKIVFSPSGKVWDSARHAEAAIYKSVPLISRPYCKLASNINITEDNSIFYDVKLKNNSFQITDIEKLKSSINEVLLDDQLYLRKSNLWFQEMSNKNTLLKRASYIVDIIKDNLKRN